MLNTGNDKPAQANTQFFVTVVGVVKMQPPSPQCPYGEYIIAQLGKGVSATYRRLTIDKPSFHVPAYAVTSVDLYQRLVSGGKNSSVADT